MVQNKRAPPGVVLVDVAAARRDEEAAGSISQDTQDTQIQWSLFSLFHPALQTIFSVWFPVVFRSESRGVFLVFFVIWCCLPRKICTMFLLLLSCSRPITHGDDELASRAPELQLRVWSDESFFRLREQPNHRICWGQPYLAIVLAHVFLTIFGACTALPPKPSVERVWFSAHF